MAITTRYAVNMAMQYNEIELSGFLINPSVGSRRFLTEAEQTRLLRATEVSALYFITDTSGQFYSARYRWYNAGGTMLNEYILSLTGASVHNSIPVDWTSFYVPSGATRLTVAIIGAVNGFSNGQFALGSGNTFTSWTLTQPSRTNLLLYSNTFQNAAWIKIAVTATDNSVIAPDGTTTAALIQLGAGTTVKGIAQAVAIASTLDRVAHFSVKQGTHRYVQIQIDGAVIFCNFDLQSGTIGNATGCTGEIYSEDNGFYRCIIKYNSDRISPVLWAVNSLADGISPNTSSTGTFYVNLAQSEVGTFATPAILTTNATVTNSLGEFIQSVSGGLNGTRCIKMWVDNGGVTPELSQSVSLVDGVEYAINFWAKLDNEYGEDEMIVNGASVLLDSLAWKRYQAVFTQSGTGSIPIEFLYRNVVNYGFVSVDDVSISPTSVSLLSEERTFILDDSCSAYEYQLNWLNKLGGRDTWVMTGFPTETVDVRRNNEVEYSARTNYTSPNRIYGYRENKSRKSITLTHQCKGRATAEWLKSELIDSIDVLIYIGGVYYPCDVVPSSIVIRNTFSQDYTIRLTLRYAYDINVQTR